jgi:hypothetical protein
MSKGNQPAARIYAVFNGKDHAALAGNRMVEIGALFETKTNTGNLSGEIMSFPRQWDSPFVPRRIVVVYAKGGASDGEPGVPVAADTE